MTCTRTMKNCDNDKEDDASAWNETWLWWSKFHERLEFDKRVGVALELSADLPTEDVIQRWLGEPVKAIIVPTSIFHNNKKGYVFFVLEVINFSVNIASSYCSYEM